MKKKYSIEDMDVLAKTKEGLCLSKKYFDTHTKLHWECKEGHRWEATPHSIKQGKWCPHSDCKGKKIGDALRGNIAEMKKIALKKEGKCLSEEYKTARTKLRWQCNKGHRWEARPDHIKRGSWCPICPYILSADKRNLAIEEMRRVAKSRGGKCISEEYINSVTKLLWECKEGHRWKAKPVIIKRGRWCPTCGGSEKLTIDEMKELAKDRGGWCLSPQYINANTKLLWKCEMAHQWEATPASVKSGSWCPLCSVNLSERICREYFENIFSKPFPKKKPSWLVNREGKRMELDGYSEKLGIAFEYQGIQHFEIAPPLVSTKTELEKRRLDDSQKEKICKTKGIKLFIIDYLTPTEGIPKEIKKQAKLIGIDTANLNFNVSVDTNKLHSPKELEKLGRIAKVRGGKCLSSFYLSAHDKLLWQCKKGHEWSAAPTNIKRGRWCPECGRQSMKETLRRYNIEDMRQLAKAKGGKCLSSKYLHPHEKLLWQCKKGHQWEATPNNIKRDRWCPKCRKKRAN